MNILHHPTPSGVAHPSVSTSISKFYVLSPGLQWLPGCCVTDD
ncbi:MAG: hypothetical protein ABSG15_07455 [FCB group bacterium]